MRKWLILIMVMTTSLSLYSCKKSTYEEELEDLTEMAETLDEASEKDAAETESLTDNENPEESEEEVNPNSESLDTADINDATEELDWQAFLKEYEEWVDSYVEFMEKYNENPGDPELLSDYTEILAQTAEWATKTEEFQDDLELMSPGDVAEYISEITRINAKMLNVY